MSFLLMIGLVIMWVLLADTRRRLKSLEEGQLRYGVGESIDPFARTPAATVRTASAVAMRSEDAIDPVLATERLGPWTRAEPDLQDGPEEKSLLTEKEQPEEAEREADLSAQSSPTLTPEAMDGDEFDVPEPAPIARHIGFEELFGRKLPIWAGGATLAVAGVLLVKYSIDAGLLSPAVRVVMGLLFGCGLIAGAEFALRQEHHVQDVRVRQSLAGAGVASLYAAILAAANLYHLIDPVTAFAGLAAVTALAMGLSLRFGAPSAVLGLVGGLAAPALVNAGPPNVPLLCGYLALAIGGLCAVSRTQRWMWLGVSALIGGAGWSAILVLTGGLDFASTLSVGFLLLALGVALPLFVFTDSRAVVLRGGAALVAAAQMASLVATGGFTLLHWGLYGLLSLAMPWLAGRDRQLLPVPAIGLAVGLLLAAFWPHPDQGKFTLVMLAMTALYGGPALWRLWRAGGSMIEAGQIAGLALAGYAITLWHFRVGDGMDAGFAAMALGAAVLPALGASLGWRNADRGGDARFATLSISGAVLVAMAGLFGLPQWMLPVAVAGPAVGLLLLSDKADDRRVEAGALSFLLISVTCLMGTDLTGHQLLRLAGQADPTDAGQALLRWTSIAAASGLFAWRVRSMEMRKPLQAGSALLGYGALAQVVPAAWLAISIALGLVAMMEVSRRLPSRSLMPAVGVLTALTGLWALQPLAVWCAQALLSLGGAPMMASHLPGLAMTAQRLAIPAILVGIALWRHSESLTIFERRAGMGLFTILGAVSLHIAWKQLFLLSDNSDFVRLALAERTLWEALLMASGHVLWQRLGVKQAAMALAATAMAHNVWYSLVLHNPLWAEQAVGSVPLANLLIPAFGLPMAGLWMMGQIAPDIGRRFARPFDMGRMMIILLFAFAVLRQLFSGTLLVGSPISEVENIGWSVLTIALAIGFLAWGIRKGLHDWRIASLILMLTAVAKVFLLDASGLEGLLRIASFLALGFSLIGIGWLYSRYLRVENN